MHLAFLDEFGHCGPYKARSDPRYNQSPVFGLAGYVIPHIEARNFATFVLKLKSTMLAADLAHVRKHPATWEKKGSALITTKNIRKYAHIREGLSRFLNELYKRQGRIFWYGREKYLSPEQSRPSGLYSTVLGHSIRNLNDFVKGNNSQFMMILDQHSDRIRLIETAAKTMFSPENPTRSLIEPPFEVESHLYQTIQAADWIATLVGRLLTHQVAPQAYSDWEWSERLFGEKVRSLSTNSRLWRPRPKTTRPLALGPPKER